MLNSSKLNQYWTDIYFHLHYPHGEKITHQVVRILQLIEKKDRVVVNDVATHLKISPNTASEHVKRMIHKKYIEKKRDQNDERKVILQLTDFGKNVLHENTSLDVEKLKHVFSKMDEVEQELISKAFKLLSERAKSCM
ncbi:MarR family winged helix-turn-helix transcriptional regulator [Fictibacillus phosphorivorans]|uniref:MarR family winged helix-turn-helix transcriptional regulator n=1 Tax=Fictibacillus phosphorivorans TaxID=1221500 RepID=UPI0011A2AF3F|nr:MarR family winged helix-turn-helix transcriptional regulator [Fictibacillus phosphorivorans]